MLTFYIASALCSVCPTITVVGGLSAINMELEAVHLVRVAIMGMALSGIKYNIDQKAALCIWLAPPCTKDANHVAPLVASSTSYSLNRPLRFVNPTFLASITIFL